MTPILITIVQSDFGFNWNFTLTDSQGVVINLTSATLFFTAQLVSDLTVNFKNSMNITSPTAGTCFYTVQANDFIVPGTYNGQIIVQYGAGETVRFSDITIVVEPSLPTS